MIWNKKKLIVFFEQHMQEEVLLEESSGLLKIQGKLNYVEELDLCDYTLFEVLLKNNYENIDTFITLHDEFIGIQHLGKNEKSEKHIKYYPVQIQYKNLIVKLASTNLTKV